MLDLVPSLYLRVVRFVAESNSKVVSTVNSTTREEVQPNSRNTFPFLTPSERREEEEETRRFATLSPRPKQIASSKFDLPDPFAPVMQLKPGPKVIFALLLNDLKPSTVAHNRALILPACAREKLALESRDVLRAASGVRMM